MAPAQGPNPRRRAVAMLAGERSNSVDCAFFTLPSVHWEEVRQLRHQVFVIEQGVPLALEQDDDDAQAIHLAARIPPDLVGTLRLVTHDSRAKLGRVAVAGTHRRQGIARLMMQRAIEHCRAQGISVITLHAQIDSRALYEGLGFSPTGTVFMEAGIQHIRLELMISAS